MNKYIIKIILLITLFLSISLQTTKAQCSGVNIQDSLALVELYNTTGGNNWQNNDNWLLGPVSTWYGIILTDDNCRVTTLSLGFNNLSGNIPSEIGNLDSLESLYLSNNQITTIPPEIGNLNNLRLFSLSDSQITTIPPEIGNLNSLELLYLANNQITTIPPEIGNLNNLKHLRLNQNYITVVPSEIWNLNNLEFFYIYDNQIENISPEIENLNNLKSVYLSNNQITSIPPEVGNLSNLKFLHLSDNQITSIPPEIGNLDSLKSLDLSYNQITSIPPEVGNLNKLEYLYLSYNQITSIPPEIGNLSNLILLWVSNNTIETTVPESLSLLVDLEELMLNNNSLIGCFPNALKSFCENNVSIDISNNVDLCNSNWETFCSKNEGACETTFDFLNNSLEVITRQYFVTNANKNYHFYFNQTFDNPPKIYLLNILGQEIEQIDIAMEKLFFPTSNICLTNPLARYSPGMYLVVIEYNNQVAVAKILK